MDKDSSELARQARIEIELLQARLLDVRNDIVQWKEIAKSNQEHFYLDEMLDCVMALQRIAEGRLANLDPKHEGEQWETHLNHLADAYWGAKRVRGYSFGAHLSSLVMDVPWRMPADEGKPKSTEVFGTGQNIEKLREECFWSLEELAAKTGLDKKQIIWHIKGRNKPRWRTLKLYSQAFSKELGRDITVADLEK